MDREIKSDTTAMIKYQIDRAKEYVKKNSSYDSEPTLETCIIHDMVRRVEQLQGKVEHYKDLAKTNTDELFKVSDKNTKLEQENVRLKADLAQAKKVLEEAAEEIENGYGRETEFTEKIRDLIDKGE